MLRHERGGTERHAPRRLTERFEFQNRIVVMPVAVHRDRHERRALAAQRQPLMEQRRNTSVINRHPGDHQLVRPGFQDRGTALGIGPIRFGKLGTAEAFRHRPQRPLRRSGRTEISNVNPFDFHICPPLSGLRQHCAGTFLSATKAFYL